MVINRTGMDISNCSYMQKNVLAKSMDVNWNGFVLKELDFSS